MNRKNLSLAGGVGAFALFAIWLAANNINKPNDPPEPGWEKIYFGTIEAQEVKFCTKGEFYSYAYGKDAWRCVERDTLLIGNLRFEVNGRKKVASLLLGLDGRDYYGVRYNDSTQVVAIRALDRE